MTYIGFIPVLFAFLATVASLKSIYISRVLWLISIVLVIIWTFHHGAHHLPDLRSLGSW